VENLVNNPHLDISILNRKDLTYISKFYDQKLPGWKIETPSVVHNFSSNFENFCYDSIDNNIDLNFTRIAVNNLNLDFFFNSDEINILMKENTPFFTDNKNSDLDMTFSEIFQEWQEKLPFILQNYHNYDFF